MTKYLRHLLKVSDILSFLSMYLLAIMSIGYMMTTASSYTMCLQMTLCSALMMAEPLWMARSTVNDVAADMDLNGAIDIADVNAVINAMLGK